MQLARYAARCPNLPPTPPSNAYGVWSNKAGKNVATRNTVFDWRKLRKITCVCVCFLGAGRVCKRPELPSRGGCIHVFEPRGVADEIAHPPEMMLGLRRARGVKLLAQRIEGATCRFAGIGQHRREGDLSDLKPALRVEAGRALTIER